MSFPRYERYKESNHPTFTGIPVHWQDARLKTLLAQKITDGPHETPEFLAEGVPFLSVDGIQNGELIFEGCRFISAEANETYRKKVQPRRDDLLLAKAASTGKIARVKTDIKFNIWSPLAVIRVNRTLVEPAFLELVMQTPELQAQIEMLCTANTQKNISMDDIPSLTLPLPSLDEQRDIVLFLEPEMARTDALIEEQRRLIELLKEKRQAVIFNAVTKGLDPSVSMSESKLQWLGSLPKFWQVIPIKYVAKVESGHTPDKKVEAYWESGTIPWVSLNDTGFLRNNDFITETAYYTTSAGIENSSARLLPAGAVVFSRDATIGRCAITTKPMAVSQHFIAWICGNRVCPEYLLRVCAAMQDELERLCTGATIKTIGMADIGALSMPLPSVFEQEAIVQTIREETKKVDLLIAQANTGQHLLQERRSALISAAVTGKIDVRNYAKQSTKETA